MWRERVGRSLVLFVLRAGWPARRGGGGEEEEEEESIATPNGAGAWYTW